MRRCAYALVLLSALGVTTSLVTSQRGEASGGGVATPRFVRLQNSSPGVRETGNANVSGTMIAGRFVGDGSGLSNLVAGGLAPGTYTGAYNFSNPANQFCGDGSCLTNLTAANLVGLVPDASLPTNLARMLTPNNVNSATTGFNVTQGGAGSGMSILLSSGTNSADAVSINNAGIGNGLAITLSNAANGARGVTVIHSGVGPGVFASCVGGNASWGITNSISSAGVIGDNNAGNPMDPTSSSGEAVVGRARGNAGVGAVVGRNDGFGGFGVRGFVTKTGSIGVMGQGGISGSNSHAGWFENVNAANDRTVLEVRQHASATPLALNVVGDAAISGNLSKGGGSFKIDHPLNPENQYLYHSFVESPDMKNIYDGVVELNSNGEAWVTLPKWFQALNSDYRYQLTCMGGFANVYIAEEIANNKFKIGGGKAGLRVSWQVTGIRIDPYANANRIPVEEWKKLEDRGTYLHPGAYGKSPERMTGYKAPFEGGGGALASDYPAGQQPRR